MAVPFFVSLEVRSSKLYVLPGKQKSRNAGPDLIHSAEREGLLAVIPWSPEVKIKSVAAQYFVSLEVL